MRWKQASRSPPIPPSRVGAVAPSRASASGSLQAGESEAIAIGTHATVSEMRTSAKPVRAMLPPRPSNTGDKLQGCDRVGPCQLDPFVGRPRAPMDFTLVLV
ncbi:MAG: hypothetical protein EHM79_21270 [Geobacter sp.]|nr:MAG: hypothetical protein EHM79_21270 [Geobacter sp.]